jgi:glycosyltransferase involved in cell wall biosynthesis
MTRARVLLVQRRLPHYRVPLFDRMRESLHGAGVQFELLHGQPTAAERQKDDSGILDWARSSESVYLLGGRLCWQRLQGTDRGADLVIASQENKLLYNHLAITVRRPKRFAFLGHGANLQSADPDNLRERFKRWTARQPDWWFAYTEFAADRVKMSGFATDRITVINNAIDDSELRRDIAAVDPDAVARRRAAGGPIGLFIGSLYEDKRLPFLMDAAEAIRARIPGFELAIAGDGPMRDWLVQRIATLPWVRWHGPVRGAEKALLMRSADVLINPGLVGLAITDGFVAALPTLTTDCGIHSPEIAYLEDNQNGCMTADSIDAYADRVSAVLSDAGTLRRLREGAARSADVYTLDAMVARWTQGILACLERPPRRDDGSAP